MVRTAVLALTALALADAAAAQPCPNGVCVRADARPGGVVLIVQNDRPEPMRVTLWFSRLEGYQPDVRTPHALVVPSRSAREALTLAQTRGEARYTYEYDYQPDPEPACDRVRVCLRAERDGEALRFVAESRHGAPLTLWLTHGDRADSAVVAPGTRVEVARRPPDERMPPWRFHWALGTPDLRPDSLYAYALPYPTGQSYVLVQGPDPSAGPQNRYAFAWEAPAGTPVRAARDGVVMAVVDTLDDRPVTRPVLGRERPATIDGRPLRPGQMVRAQSANYLFVGHDDGTVGRYIQLQRRSARVRPGERVTRGQPLAAAAGPVFSFNVVEMSRHEQVSQPIRFRVGGRAVVLAAGDQPTAEE